MKRSLIVLLILLQLAGLFIFENVYQLLKQFESREQAAIIQWAETAADWIVQQYRQGAAPQKKSNFFDTITFAPGTRAVREMEVRGKELILTMRKPVSASRSITFSKKIDSPTLRSARTIRRIFSILILMLGLFTLGCGIWLAVSFKRSRHSGAESPTQDLEPLQGYLFELKKMQDELQGVVQRQQKTARQQEELSQSIISHINLGIILVNGEGRIETFNPYAQQLFGRSYASVARHRPEEAFSSFPKLQPFIGARESAAANAAAEIEEGQRLLAVEKIPLREGGILVLVRDITEERQREKIAAVNRNFIMLGEMATFLAHEVKNSLAVIYGYLRTLQADPEKIAKISQEVNFLVAMMEKFFDFSRPLEPLRLERTNLRSLLEKIAAQQEILSEFAGEDLIMESDPLMLSVIFSNLLLNAKQAGATRVQIVFSRQPSPTVVVNDDGSGVPAAIRDQIWLPFFSTREKGSGMGLPLVRKMILALGGDILVEAPEGPHAKGARFVLTFYHRA